MSDIFGTPNCPECGHRQLNHSEWGCTQWNCDCGEEFA